ncbi:DoxX family protein [Falsiroseomonas oryziterrae]|uniref:DoxX family protein n=1 Tax=Falsiroseomonas oryziterrae TaxID=2911368 RepID=UPI001F21951B|nr:DoxX family protein [Roseomonas sp. NPKOSM-4]
MLATLRTKLDTVVEPLAYTFLRVISGTYLIAHGWPKWQAGVETFARMGLARRGIEPALPLAWMVVSLEVIGGLLIAIGLLTRFTAVLATGHLAFITFFVLWPAGFAWNRGGWEFASFWAVVMLFIAVRGGGVYSADRFVFARMGSTAPSVGRG